MRFHFPLLVSTPKLDKSFSETYTPLGFLEEYVLLLSPVAVGAEEGMRNFWP